MNAFNRNLARELIRSLQRNFWNLALIDHGFPKPFRLRKGTLLALSLGLARELRTLTEDRRIGVVLPPGVAGTIANLALIFADKVPVNLNVTAGPDSIIQSMRKARVGLLLSADELTSKFPAFPWTNEIFDVGDWLRKKKRRKWKLSYLHLLAFLCPLRLISKIATSEQNIDEEAVLLFTSGSSGNPKGVVLSHRNLLSNCAQIRSTNLFQRQDRVLANLPLFHSFGFTVSTLYPLLSDLVMISVPSPLDVKSSLRAIEREKVEVLLGTPTFLRGYLRRAKREQLKSIRFVVAGAEKTPDGFKEEWESFCNCSYLEGYGLTETSPAISFNLPERGAKENSVGRLLPGIECKSLALETFAELPMGEVGILCFRGPNVFGGYLEDSAANKESFDGEGWFVTGDLGRLDEEGFLFIEGRISRFSKIGGEMIPHAKVEFETTKILFPKGVEKTVCAVVGLSDTNKGERLVLLTTEDFDLQALREQLVERGMPNLWIPKEKKVVSEIPFLASGKLDLSRLKEIAVE